MSQLIADRRDVDFVLYEQLKVHIIFESHKKYIEFNRKFIDLIISEARQFAIKELLPSRKIGDDEGCRFEAGKVHTPECFRRLWKMYVQGDWLAMTESAEWGGQEFPRVISMAAHDYLIGGNYAFMMYPGLTQGAAKLIEVLGSRSQKDIFLKKMYSGAWSGTMLLTESQAGSDVGALSTRARKNDDHTYSIEGDKIFISSGEHDLTENIIHLVLARIEGAPSGTKGISLFIVPKIWVDENGNAAGPNDVVCTGIERKMGIHGNATVSLALGGKGKCKGLLLGEENKGMAAMFVMMNEARLLVGMQGFCCAGASYLNALQYARERMQGKELQKMRSSPAKPVPIIRHPDVRRMLMVMKSHVEGMRSLLYYVQFLVDRANMSTDPSEREKFSGMVDLLIPVCKAYITDRSFELCSIGIQVYGGYGYIRDYPQEQLLRDCRITMIYEGTNGIQAMDLLGRKLGKNQGKSFADLMEEMQKTVTLARSIEGLEKKALKVEEVLNRLSEVVMHMGKLALSSQLIRAFAFSSPFLETMGDVLMAWMLLWRSIAAQKVTERDQSRKDVLFYEGLIKSADYFIFSVLPVTEGKMASILIADPAPVEISDESF